MNTFEIIFSPTGGTKKVADIISQELGNEIIEVDLTSPTQNFSDYNLTDEDLAVIAVPSYGGRAPEVAIDRLKELNGNGAKAILVVVYGNRDYEDTLIELFDTTTEQGFEPAGGIAAIAQHSILPQYASGRPDTKDEASLKGFVKSLLDNQLKPIDSVPGNRPYKKISNLPLVPKPSKNCTKCKVCVTVCPVDAIDPNTLKSDKKKCISCMRCVTICPSNARSVNKLMTKAASLALKKEATARKENELFI